MNTVTTNDENVIEGVLKELIEREHCDPELLIPFLVYMKQNDLVCLEIDDPTEPEEDFMNTNVRISLNDDRNKITIEILD